jgi:hypothetical protein
VHWARRQVIVVLYHPRMMDDDECEAVGGMRIGRGNRSTQGNPCPSATLSTTNPTYLTLDRTRTACAVVLSNMELTDAACSMFANSLVSVMYLFLR